MSQKLGDIMLELMARHIVYVGQFQRAPSSFLLIVLVKRGCDHKAKEQENDEFERHGRNFYQTRLAVASTLTIHQSQ